MQIHVIQHAGFEYPGTILQWASENAHSCRFTHIAAGDPLPDAADWDMLVVMGGPMGVYEENQYPWLKTEKAYLRAAIATEKKLLGICLGAQLLADQLGATVAPHSEKEIGWWPVRKAGLHALTQNLPENFYAFHLHGDSFTLPAGATRLFSSAACTEQGFVYGSKNQVAALQFHPEMETELLAGMLAHEAASLKEAPFVQTAPQINQLANGWLPLQQKIMHQFLDNFCRE